MLIYPTRGPRIYVVAWYVISQIGESGKTTKELEKTISLLKKVVERTQAENEALKQSSAGSEQVQHLQSENEVLRVS